MLGIVRRPGQAHQPARLHRPRRLHGRVPGRRDQARLRHRRARRRAAASSIRTSRPTAPGVYVVGELGGMGLIRNAVEQGRQAAAHHRGERRAAARATRSTRVVVGAGPAGMSATLRLDGSAASASSSLEREELGGTIVHYPRAKVVMTGALELPGRGTVERQDDEQGGARRAVGSMHAETRHRRAGPACASTGSRAKRGRLARRGSDGERRAANVRARARPPRHAAQARRPRRGARQGRATGCSSPRSSTASTCSSSAAATPPSTARSRSSSSGGCASVTISYRRAELARCAPASAAIEELIHGGTVAPLMPSEVSRSRRARSTLKRRRRQASSSPTTRSSCRSAAPRPPSSSPTFGIETVEKRGERCTRHPPRPLGWHFRQNFLSVSLQT